MDGSLTTNWELWSVLWTLPDFYALQSWRPRRTMKPWLSKRRLTWITSTTCTPSSHQLCQNKTLENPAIVTAGWHIRKCFCFQESLSRPSLQLQMVNPQCPCLPHTPTEFQVVMISLIQLIRQQWNILPPHFSTVSYSQQHVRDAKTVLMASTTLRQLHGRHRMIQLSGQQSELKCKNTYWTIRALYVKSIGVRTWTNYMLTSDRSMVYPTIRSCFTLPRKLLNPYTMVTHICLHTKNMAQSQPMKGTPTGK